MSETKFGGKSGAHSETFSLASEIFAKLALITPPYLHIASPLAMKERKKERAYKKITK